MKGRGDGRKKIYETRKSIDRNMIEQWRTLVIYESF